MTSGVGVVPPGTGDVGLSPRRERGRVVSMSASWALLSGVRNESQRFI